MTKFIAVIFGLAILLLTLALISGFAYCVGMIGLLAYHTPVYGYKEYVIMGLVLFIFIRILEGVIKWVKS